MGLDMMGVENLSSAASFLSTSAESRTGSWVLPTAAWSPCFSVSQSSAACASPRTFSRSAASMCSCAASGAAAARTAEALAWRRAQAPGLALSSLARSSIGSPIALSSSSLALYTPLVSSSPSS